MDTLEFQVGAGALAFIRLETRWGALSARNKLHPVDEAQGKAGVLECRLAESRAPMQSVDVHLEAEDPAWHGPLECVASNPFGSWAFVAPGSVSVATSNAPLQITCARPGEGAGATGALAGGATVPSRDVVRRATGTGTAVGAGAGAALGAAAAPVMGPAFAIVLAVGVALRGAEVGAIVGSVTANDLVEYPSPVLIRVSPAPRAQ